MSKRATRLVLWGFGVALMLVVIGLNASGAFAWNLTGRAPTAGVAPIHTGAAQAKGAPQGPAVGFVNGKGVSVRSAQPPAAVDAYMHWVYNGGTPTIITVPVGTHLPMDLFLNAGTNPDATAQQSYMTFTYSVLQIVDGAQSGCVPTQTITPDTTTFDAALQNEICNGPSPCNFRGNLVDGGSFAFASGALQNCPNGCGGDFRVASAVWCASNRGRAYVHWQFSPPAPPTRDSNIINLNGDLIQDDALYQDFIVDVIGPPATATSTPSPTDTSTPVVTVTPTRTNTPSVTITPTRTNTPTFDPTPTPTETNTPTEHTWNH